MKKQEEIRITTLSGKEKRALSYIREHGSIDPDRARKDIGDGRLSETILQLRRKGYDIDTIRVDITNRYGEPSWYGKYVLAKK